MKYNKMLENNDTNKNTFLITCVCSILLLLTMCYFGINTEIKGTSAAVTCGTSESNVDGYCCPLGYTKAVVTYNGTKYCMSTAYYNGNNCYRDNVEDASTLMNQGWSCDVPSSSSLYYTCTTDDLSKCGSTPSNSYYACYESSGKYYWGYYSSSLGYSGYTAVGGEDYDTESECLSHNTYTIYYDYNNGNGKYGSQTKKHSVSIALSSGTPTATGYTFVSWNTETDGSGTTYAPGDTYSDNADLTLYAQWTANKYTITWDANGGTLAINSSETYTSTHTYGSSTTLMGGVTQSGYTFTGWYTAASGGTKIGDSGASYTVTKNITMYAQWDKDAVSATIPTASSYCKSGLTYTGSSQTLTNTAGTGYTFSNNTGTDAGSYTVKATLKSGYEWSDGATGTKTFTCSIGKATPTLTLSKTSLSVVEGSTGTFTVKGSVVGDFKITSGTTSKATVSPSSLSDIAKNTEKTVTVTGVAAGTSTVTVAFTPNDTDNYKTPSSKTVSVTVTEPEATKITAPTNSLCVSRTYTGSAQQLTSATSGTGYTLSGYSQTNAGNYSVVATLKSGYAWSDGSTGTKTFTCSISKATPTVTLSSSTLSVEVGGTKTFTVTGSVAGDLKITSSATGKATVSPGTINDAAKNTAKTVTVAGVAAGTSTVTVAFTPNDTDNYNTPTSKTVAVTVSQTVTTEVPTLTIAKSEVELITDDSAALNYTYSGDGTLSCSSANTAVATCSVSGGKLNITAKGVGTTVVTLSASATSKYEAVSKQVTVTVTEEEIEEDRFTATFNENGGIINGSGTKSCTTSTTSCEITSLPTATRNGYTFKGWGTGSTCTSGSTDKLTLTKDTTYYACWLAVSTENPTDTDNEGNVTNNSQTGEIAIAIVWFMGIFAIGYAFYYFKAVKEN